MNELRFTILYPQALFNPARQMSIERHERVKLNSFATRSPLHQTPSPPEKAPETHKKAYQHSIQNMTPPLVGH